MAMTPPPRMGAQPADETAEGMTEPGETESEAGQEFTLHVAPDGRMSVYWEQDGQEQDRRDVPNVGEGLKAILDLYRTNASRDDQQAFEAGYGADDQAPRAPARGGMR